MWCLEASDSVDIVISVMQSKTENPHSKKAPLRSKKTVIKKKDALKLGADLPPLTRYQKYAETPGSRVPNWLLIPAPYNARFIDPVARQKLTDEVRRGLVSRLCWNRRTRYIIGGHQRSDILCELEGLCSSCNGALEKLSPLWRAVRSGKPHDLNSWLPPGSPEDSPDQCVVCHGSGFKPFSLDVDINDLDSAAEKRTNLFLNNQSAMGQTDGEKLSALLHDMSSQGVNYSDAGFDAIDLELLQVDQTLYLVSEDDPEAVKPIVEDAEAIAEMKKLRREHREESRNEGQEIANRVVMIQFDSEADRAKLLARLGIRADDPTGGVVKGGRLLEALGLRS